MGRGAASQSHRASAEEIHPPAGQYYRSNDKHGWARVLRFYNTPPPNESIPAWLSLGATADALLALTAALVLRLERQCLSALQHTYVIISSLDRLSNLEDSDIGAREYVLTGEPLSLEGYERSRQAVNEEFIRLRELAKDLRLTAASSELCEELSAREGIEVVFKQEVRKALPVDVASCLYRASQADLHNVIKHSLGNMKERVLLVQGEFSIHSQPGQGTTVEIFVPLSKEAI
jgi:CHASE3 domain sensor protein